MQVKGNENQRGEEVEEEGENQRRRQLVWRKIERGSTQKQCETTD